MTWIRFFDAIPEDGSNILLKLSFYNGTYEIYKGFMLDKTFFLTNKIKLSERKIPYKMHYLMLLNKDLSWKLNEMEEVEEFDRLA